MVGSAVAQLTESSGGRRQVVAGRSDHLEAATSEAIGQLPGCPFGTGPSRHRGSEAGHTRTTSRSTSVTLELVEQIGELFDVEATIAQTHVFVDEQSDPRASSRRGPDATRSRKGCCQSSVRWSSTRLRLPA